MDNFWFAFFLTFLAGISTGIGSIMSFFSKNFNTKFLSASLGFSAGVMIYVSFVEILSKSKRFLSISLGEEKGYYFSVLSFFIGIAIIAIIDNLIPSFENPHEIKNINENSYEKRKKKLLRTGFFTFLAITIHNFPEGLATLVAALSDPRLGISIAVAIAIHNIPEGIATSIPIYYSTGSKRKAFYFSFLSGIAEPLGAVLGYILLKAVFNNTTFGIIFGIVAGIMVYISLDELLPTAEEYGYHHLSILGLILGMFIMALSLIMFI
ncbi:MAG TPA: zinc transporter ZupT [Spirochaetota bacterium]|nr:zinc transporter ZupT [Spirochaetota bacterium]HOM38132.1 zinc transporter ZupT [Spirochaetota bacterium]HPQ48935.1 zinc transporter ZupT [Spirochaetota bacterium]